MPAVNVPAALLNKTKAARRALTGESYDNAQVVEAALDVAHLMWTNEQARKTETERHTEFRKKYDRAKAGRDVDPS